MVEGTSLALTVTPGDKNHKIYYTTSGTPAADLFAQGAGAKGLFLYDGEGIFIEESKNPADYALTPNVICGADNVNAANYSFGYVSKGVPLSLIEVDEKGEIVAQARGTYVFHAEGKSHFGNVPVVCLSAPVDDWIGADKASGVYNTLAEELKLRAQLEYYDYGADETFSLNTQIKRGGNWTKNLPIRTLNANFKKNENGEKNPKPTANIFQDRIALGTKKPIQGEVRRFRLHTGGNDVFYSFFNDAFVQRMVSLSQTSIATAAYRPCVLYLNGEYWGVYALREHYDADYLEYTFGVDADDVVYIDKTFNRDIWATEDIVKTDDVELGKQLLAELYGFLGYSENADGTYTLDESKDWTSAEVYEEFCNFVDVDSLIDYILIQGYIANGDFMANNFRMWRTIPKPTKNKTKKSAYGDGKWRFMLHDTDLGVSNAESSVFTGYMNKTPPHNLILALPAQNAAFKARLWERAQYIQDTVFAPENAIAVLDAMEAEIEPLYADKIERWGAKGYSMESWKAAVEVRRKFLRERPNYFLNDVKSAFSITE